MLRLTLLISAAVCVAHGAVPAWERQALIDLYDATGGKHWKQRGGWKQGDPCEDEWFGIFCDPANTTVHELFPNPRSSGNPLVGTLPDSIYNLSNLKHMYLSNDHPPGWSNLHGELSPLIGKLRKLKCLYLRFWSSPPFPRCARAET
jgi:hypothetical protein